ncbi:MAG: hypothetical protein ACJ8GN_20535 [Longimicrobiaceae bacterium]
MKPLVTEEIVEQTLGAFEVASPEEREAMRQGCGPFQEDLAGFVAAFSMGLPDRERGLTLALLALIIDAFRRTGATFRKIRKGEILHAWKASAAFVRDLQTKPEGPVTVAEPELMLLILDLVIGSDPANLDPDAPSLVSVRILKTAADCIHRAGALPAARR